MVPNSTRRVRIAALILSLVGLALAAASANVSAQTLSPPATWGQRETASAALARHIRVLATSPKDFLALIGAGKAALALGDSQAAIGFFGRADEVWPSSPQPQAGLGAALASEGDASGAMPYFDRARRLGATATMIGADRGLAYDLLGRHSEAQADYRAALGGADGEEARRRLSLSLAITGDKKAAIDLLAPLMARGDPGAARVRALVLALSGDMAGARRSIDAAMPGSAVRMAPFFAKLPSLRSDQKAAAVNLGIFPDSGQPAYAYVPQPSAGGRAQTIQPPAQATIRPSTPSQPSSVAAAPPPRRAPGTSIVGAIPMSGDRLSSIDELLRGSNSSSATERTVEVASITPSSRAKTAEQSARPTAKPRVWVQLASGSNPAALPEQFRRLKTRHSTLLDGMSGYVAEGADRSRLLVGPFKSASDANIIIEDLESVHVDAFSWTSPPGQMIRKLPTE